MPDTKISALTSLTGAGAAQDDVIAIVDTSALTTKKITREEFFKSIDYVTFDTTNVVANPTEGQLTWDATDKTLSLGLNGGDVVMQIGQEIHYRIRNNTGSTIPNGTVCRFAGSVGNSGILLAAPFLANGTYNSNVIMGVSTEDIPNGEDGLVTYFGKVRGINTSAFTDGATLYASPTVAGGLTATKPSAPNNVVSVAAVVSAANNGTLFVRPHVEDLPQHINTTSTELVINEAGADVDFRVESDTNANAFFVDGATGNVGIGTAPTGFALTVGGDIRTAGGSITAFEADPVRLNRITSAADAFGSYINATYGSGGSAVLRFQTANVEQMRIDSSGNVLIGTSTTGASKLRISGLPTSSAGLAAGDVWNDNGTLKIV